MTDDPNLEGRIEPEDAADEGILDEDRLTEEPLAEDQEPADDEVVEDEPAEEAPARGRDAGRRAAAGAAGGAALSARAARNRIVVDPALRIRDRVSQAFVVGTVVVFALIFLNALAFGHGGAFSAVPTAAPSIDLGSFNPLASPLTTPAPIPTEFQVPPKSPSPGASVAPS
jgi:hypothetical protein